MTATAKKVKPNKKIEKLKGKDMNGHNKKIQTIAITHKAKKVHMHEGHKAPNTNT